MTFTMQRVGRRAVALVAVTVLASWSMATTVRAQRASSGSITGKVVDETGGALPGVTLTGRSPALQLPEVTAITGPDGAYDLRDLPPGTYELTFELAGFQTLKHDAVRLTAGFTAKIDATLKVGGLAETLTVSGQSPVIDVKSSTASTNLTKEELNVLPSGRVLGDMIALAPGVRYSGAIDVGGSRSASFTGLLPVFGVSTGTQNIEGIEVAFLYTDGRAFEDVQITATGNNAEVAYPGVNFNAVLQSGGNQFHGLIAGITQTSRLQSANLDAALRARGATTSAGLVSQWDINGNFGGRIIRDRLWFFVAERQFRREFNVPGFSQAPGADGRYGTADDVAGTNKFNNPDHAFKVTYQLSKNYRLMGFQEQSVKREFARSASQFIPYESTYNYTFPPFVRKLDFSGTPSSGLLLNASVGWYGYEASYYPHDSSEASGRPRTVDITTLRQTGSAIENLQVRTTWFYSAGLSLFPSDFLGGRHEFKVGFQMNRRTDAFYTRNQLGNYILVFNNGVPFQVQLENRPASQAGTVDRPGLYATDTWRVGNLTVNLGARWDRYHAFTRDIPSTSGRFLAGPGSAGIDVLTNNDFAPRVGVAWDVRGDGKSVLKGSWGRYYYLYDSRTDAVGYAAGAGLKTGTFVWRDLNGNNNFDDGETNPNPNGPDFVSIAAANSAAVGIPPAINQLVNPDIKHPHSDEATIMFEQEIASGVALRGVGVYRANKRLFTNRNTLRPYSAWNIPISRRDPGPDGLINTPDDRGMVQLFDYDPAFRGSRFVSNVSTNVPLENHDYYRGWEVDLVKRMQSRWSATGSIQMVKNHATRLTALVPSSPNDLFFPLQEDWDWSAKVYGTYRAPWNVEVSGVLNVLRGAPTQRTYVFGTVDPLGGRPLSQAGTLNIPLEPLGSDHLQPQKVVNLKIARPFPLPGGTRLQVDVQVFNLLNDNTPTTVSRVSGPAFNRVTAFTPPRVAAIGAEFRF
jgi:hypothetical protein